VAAPTANGGKEIVPFSGVSFTKFLHQLIDKTGSASERLQNLVGNLIPGAAQASVKSGNKDTGPGLSGSGILDGKMAAGISQQRFKVEGIKDKDDMGISPEDQARLKKVFADAKDDMKRAYSQALMVDPTLAVTVAFEVTVAPNGSLSLSGFKAQGKSQPHGLSKLREGLAEIFKKLSVEKKFTGLKIRGENAFIH
jgi:hypothetical protein